MEAHARLKLNVGPREILAMNIRTWYLILCIAGFVLPYSQFVPWSMEHGLDVSLFIRDLFSNRIGGFFGFDVIISACVLIPFVVSEGRRLRMPRLWLPIIGTFFVGVSFGFPLFLYLRQPYIQEPNKPLQPIAPKDGASVER